VTPICLLARRDSSFVFCIRFLIGGQAAALLMQARSFGIADARRLDAGPSHAAPTRRNYEALGVR